MHMDIQSQTQKRRYYIITIKTQVLESPYWTILNENTHVQSKTLNREKQKLMNIVSPKYFVPSAKVFGLNY